MRRTALADVEKLSQIAQPDAMHVPRLDEALDRRRPRGRGRESLHVR